MAIRPSRAKLLPAIASIAGTEIIGVTQAAGAEGSLTVAQIVAAAAAITAGASLTVQPTANRIYQRDTSSGGAFGKGAGAVPVSVTLSAAAALLEYRLRDALTPANTVVDWATLASNPPAGAGAYTPAVPASHNRYLLDVRVNGYTAGAVLGTQSFGVGEHVCSAGQSLNVTMFVPNTDTTSNAALGIVPDPTCSVIATLSNGVGAWGPSGDSTVYTSTFASKFCSDLANAAGVVVGLSGYGYGAQPISFFIGNAAFTALLNSVQKWRFFIWNHGHTDSANGTTGAAYQTSLNTVLAAVDAANTYAGVKQKILQPIPNCGSAYPAAGNNTIRNAMAAVAAANPTTTTLHLQNDIKLLNADAVHPDQTGEIRHAAHTVRLVKKLLGLDTIGDAGPVITAASRAAGSAVINVGVTHTGGTDLVVAGATPSTMFKVFNSGSVATALTIASVSRTDASNFAITLSPAPADAQALGLWCGYGPVTADNGANGVWDNNLADGLATVGRHVAVTLAEFTVAAPATASPPNTPSIAVGSPTSSSLVLTLTAGSGGTPQSYTVQRALDSGFTSSLTTINGGSPIPYTASPQTFTDTGLTSGTPYFYRTTATNGSGTSGQSTAASGTPTAASAPSQVGSLAAGSPTASTIPVTYTAATGTATITYAGETSLNNSVWTANGGAFTATGGTFTGLPASTAHYLRIIATNGAGSSTTTLGGGTPSTVTTAAAAAFLLDTITSTVKGAYSLRKLRSAYAGAAVRIQRSTPDTTQQDFGFDGNGDFNSAAMMIFVGSGDGEAVKWYDQSTAGQDMVAGSRNPYLVAAGVMQTLNNATAKPALMFNLGNGGLSRNVRNAAFSITGATFAMIGVVGQAALGGSNTPRVAVYTAPSQTETGTNSAIFAFGAGPGATLGGYQGGAKSSAAAVVPYTAQLASVFDGANHTMTINTTVGAAVASTGTITTGGILCIGIDAAASVGGNQFNGPMCELIFTQGALVAGDQATIRTSQKNYYGTV